MDIEKEKFDFVCSMGGNCMAAFQLMQRGMRAFSLPFDWLYIEEPSAIFRIADCFKNNFSDFFKKENLTFVPQDKFPNNGHADNVFYKDINSGWYFLNHFYKNINDSDEYENVKKKMTRRLDRFFYCLNNSKKILFLFTHCFFIENEPYIVLCNTLKKIFPNKEIHIKVVQFSTEESSFSYGNMLEITRYPRKSNIYDFKNTNFEWEFLDKIECDFSKFTVTKKEYRFISAKCVKKGFAVVLFPFLNTILYIKLYLFGLRLFMSIGRLRNE